MESPASPLEMPSLIMMLVQRVVKNGMKNFVNDSLCSHQKSDEKDGSLAMFVELFLLFSLIHQINIITAFYHHYYI